MTTSNNRYISSERYRQMMVKDGNRRFQEWHNQFLQYQKQFLKETRSSPAPSLSPCSVPPVSS